MKLNSYKYKKLNILQTNTGVTRKASLDKNSWRSKNFSYSYLKL